MAHDSDRNGGKGRIEKAVIGANGFEKKGGYPAGQKPAKGVPPVPAGLKTPRTPPPRGKRHT